MAKKFRGIFPALVTPFAGGALGETVDLDAFKGNIGVLNSVGLSGYLVLGSTGECVSLSPDESLALVRAAKAAAAPGKLVIAGTGQESTLQTIEFTNAAARLGIDAALVRPPSYFKSKMSREALRRHYMALADAAEVPVIIYNIPQNTGVTIEPSLVVELAAHPNIVGMKESSGSVSYLEEVVVHAPDDFSYLVGSGYVLLPALVLGASGAILAVANAAPSACVRIYELFQAGKLQDAVRLQLGVAPLNKAVMDTFGIAGLKHALHQTGQNGGLVRPPLLPIDAKGREEIDALMDDLAAVRR